MARQADGMRPARNPNSLKNLRLFKAGDPATRESAVAAAKASNAAKRRRKLLRETLQELLNCKVDSSQMTAQDAVSMALLEKAMTGDVRAYEVIRDTIGQKPVEKQQTTAQVDTVVRYTWAEEE